MDVELASVGWKLGSISHLRRVPRGKPRQGNLAHHHPARILTALMYSGANTLLSTGGTRHSSEGQGEQDCYGYGPSLRTSQQSKRATIISSHSTTCNQTSANDHLTLRNCSPAGPVFGSSGHGGNRPESALISNLGGYRKITARFVRLIAFFAEPTKPRLRLE